MRVHIQAAAAISFLSIVISSFGQVVLFNEDFESDGFPLRYILSSHFNDLPNNTIFDVTTDAGHPYGGGTYTDYKGFGFFAAEDTGSLPPKIRTMRRVTSRTLRR